MKSNNIIVGVLVAVVAVMGVAFAAFSTSLTINGTAEIKSNWRITFTAGECTAVSKDGTHESEGSVSMEGSKAIVIAEMASPGDTLSCKVKVTNEGSLDAIRDSWEITSALTNTDAYEVTLSETPATTLTAGTGTETLTINIKYKNIGNELKPTGPAKFEATAIYVQALGA